MNLHVNEIFDAPQGEGILTGVLSTFVRLQGCSVHCSWCDTKYTWKPSRADDPGISVKEILDKVTQPHVVITGGEPTEQPLDELIKALQERLGVTVQVETSGMIWQPCLEGVLVTVSPKENLGWDVCDEYYTKAMEVKLVIDSTISYAMALAVLRRYNGPVIVLMPEGCPPSTATIAKVLDFQKRLMATIPRMVRVMDRLQYRFDTK